MAARYALPINGAIAQLGERVLCKHEVVGSIPSGSTILRSPAQATENQTASAAHLIFSKMAQTQDFDIVKAG